MSKKTKRNWCIFVSRGGLSYESAGLYVYVVMFQTSPLCLRSATVFFYQHPQHPISGLLCLGPSSYSFIQTYIYYTSSHRYEKPLLLFFKDMTFSLLYFFYVSTINRKFTSMDAGSWRTSRWRPFYSSVPRSTYSSFTDVLKSRVNTYLINT